MSKIFELTFYMKSAPEALERMLRVVRQRGFRVVSLQAKLQKSQEIVDNNFVIQLQVYGISREIDFLLPQIEKIYGITELKCINC